MALDLNRINAAYQAGYDDDKILDSIERNDPEFGQRIKAARESGYDSATILGSIKNRLSQQNNQPSVQERKSEPQVESPLGVNTPAILPVNTTQPQSTPVNTPATKSPGIFESFSSGLRESSTGEITRLLNGDLTDNTPKQRDFIDTFAHGIGAALGDLPAFIAGGAAGASAGGSVAGPPGAIAGAGAGAMGLSEFIKEALVQFREHRKSDETFGEFLQRAETISGSTLRGAAMGGILSAVNASLPLLKKIPGLGKVFDTKIGGKVGTIAAETAAAGTIPALSEGRLPDPIEYANAAALITGLQLPRLIRIKLAREGEKSGLTPEEFAKSERAQEILKEVPKPEKPVEKQNETAPSKETEVPKVEETKTDQKTEKTSEGLRYDQGRGEFNDTDLQGVDQTQVNVFTDLNKPSASVPVNTILQGIELTSKEKSLLKESAKEEFLDNLDKAKQLKEQAKQRIIDRINVERTRRADERTGTDQETEAPEEKLSTSKSASISIKPQQMSIKKPKESKNPAVEKKLEPIVETTGKSAKDQIEYQKSRIAKLIDATNTAIQKIKNPKKSIKEAGAAINKAVFNVLAPLENLERDIPVPERVSTRIKIAQSVASEINSVLENGVFSNETGTFKSNSLADAYGDLTWKSVTRNLKPDDYSISELNEYRTSKISLKRQSEGKKTGIDTNLATKDVARLKEKYEPLDKRIREYQKSVLDYYGKDLLGQKMIDAWNKDYYSPLYRVMEYGEDAILHSSSLKPSQPFHEFTGSNRKVLPASESDIYNSSTLIRNARKNDAILQYKQAVEKGQLPGKIQKAKKVELPSELLEELQLDNSELSVAENLYEQSRKDTYTPRPNILKGWENGKAFEIEVPKDVYDIYSTLTPQDYGQIPRILRASNRLFSKGISYAPRKFFSIFTRDALSSLIYSRSGSNPISIVEALSDIYGQKDIYKQFLSLGGDVYASRLAERIERVKKVEDLVTPGKEGPIVGIDKISEYMDKYGDTLNGISLAVPLAEYKRSVLKYGDTPEGRIMAAMEARRVTYDPTRKGGSKIVKELGNYIPFWNVSLQDLAMLAKNLKNKETWAKGIIALSLPSIALKMLNEDNPEYQDLNPVDKAAFWHIYAGDSHIRIPIPWLLGTTFKVGAESFFDLAKDRGSEAWEAIYHNFAQNLSGSLPPPMQAFSEATIGKSLPSPLGTILGTESNAPDVVPRRLQHLPYDKQYTSKTSHLARKFGELFGVSPVKVEKVAKTLGGLVVADGLALIDEIGYQTGFIEDNRPEQRENNYLLLGHFVSDSSPSRIKQANEFYKKLDEEKRKGSALGKTLSSYNSKISAKFRKLREVESSKVINPTSKRQQMKKLQIEINELYKQAVTKRV